MTKEAEVIGVWKERLDAATSFEEAESVVNDALRTGTREELLQFLADLFVEFCDDYRGGAAGTLDWMCSLTGYLFPTDEELVRFGVNPEHIRAYLAKR